MPGQTPIELAERSLQVRRAGKRIRDGLASGRLTIFDVMCDQPAELGDRALFRFCCSSAASVATACASSTRASRRTSTSL